MNAPRKAQYMAEIARQEAAKQEVITSNFTERYQRAATKMADCMNEAQHVLQDNSTLDLNPDDLLEVINGIQGMLAEAKFYATRMQVYANLLGYGTAEK